MQRTRSSLARQFLALLFAFALTIPPGLASPLALSQDPQDSSDQALLTPDQLDDLVTPIALYADPLIAQILAASTYPLEVIQANRWLQSNSQLQGTALTEAAAQQPWDPSVQALVVFPSVLAMMDKNLNWTTDLGNAFLAQEQDVMDAIQRQRARAADSGKLTSNAQQSVQRSTEDGKTVIIVQPAQPEVIYVPVYDPVVIWGPPRWHPWPAFWYPPRTYYGSAIVAGSFGFFIGISVSHYFNHWGGWNNWGWGCGWHGRRVVVHNNFYVVNNYHPPRGVVRNGRSVWEHNPRHREGVPYPTRNVANRVGHPLPADRSSYRPSNRPNYSGGGNSRPAPRPGEMRPPPSARPAPGPQPGHQPRPDPRPSNDRSALGGIQTTPGDRAQIDRDRGYASLGKRAPSRPAPSAPSRPAPKSAPSAQPRSAPAPSRPHH
jgi:Protein of unknown function (DUF3300)